MDKYKFNLIKIREMWRIIDRLLNIVYMET